VSCHNVDVQITDRQTFEKKCKQSFFSAGISDTIPHWFLLQTGSNTTTITRHHCHHFPTLSLEHLHKSLDCPPSPTLLIYLNLNPNYLGIQLSTARYSRSSGEIQSNTFYLSQQVALAMYLPNVDIIYL
jgi:hypothetical protein